MLHMNDLEALLDSESLTAAELARLIGKSKSHLSHVMAGRRSLGRPAAIAIFRKTGQKLGPIANLSDSDIDVLERVAAGAA